MVLETPFPSHRFHAVGVGEVSTSPGPSAVLMAASNAVGAWLYEYPVTPQRILKALGKTRSCNRGCQVKPFVHRNARSIGEAVRLLAKYNGRAKVNAGGTDLLGVMRDRITVDYPEAVINLKRIEGLDQIKTDSKGIRIGALAKLADVANSPDVKEEYRLLAESAYSVASPHVRNMATVGGNLAQDVRCWYYRYPRRIGGPIICLRKGGKVCSALPGDNRYHSVFGAAPLRTVSLFELLSC